MDRREFFHAAGAVGALATARAHIASQGVADPRGRSRRWIGVHAAARRSGPDESRQRNTQGPHARRAGGRHRPPIGDTSRGARSIAGGHRAVDRAGAGRHARRTVPRRVWGSRPARDRPRRRSLVAGFHELHARTTAAGRRGLPRAGPASRTARAARSAGRDDETAAGGRARIDAERSCRATTTGCCSRRRWKPG